MTLLRYLWAAPNTLLGLVFVALVRLQGGHVRVVDGVVEAHGGWVSHRLGRGVLLVDSVAAITIGHVILGLNQACLDGSRAHEHVHVRQYERWGPLFLPAYVLFSLTAWARGDDPYRENRFEREAYAVDSASPPLTDEGSSA